MLAPRAARHFALTHGVIHAVVDTVTVMTVYSTLIVHDLSLQWTFYGIIAYDLLAFAGQAPLGYLVDRLRWPREALLAGIALSALGALFLPLSALAAIALVGLGNALFHVGAGALSLYVRPGRATPPGIFVAPGALGLGLGYHLGNEGIYALAPMVLALALCFAFARRAEHPILPTIEERPTLAIPAPHLIAALLLFTIFTRALVGYAGGRDCPKLAWVPLALILASFLGKGLGGFLSDRLGWIATSVGALVLSAPLIAYFGDSPVLLVTGMFLFQMTMPVTLVAITAILPGRPGLSFGLACLVLVLGALPTFFPATRALYHPAAFLGLILLSAALLYLALGRLRGRVPMRFSGQE
ncbi:MAG: hypothetical protein P1V51_08125 [Deltaproteobacteria bacterium]|nr:hypothetical protein [Deltaproteobacteria bacterium]